MDTKIKNDLQTNLYGLFCLQNYLNMCMVHELYNFFKNQYKFKFITHLIKFL